MDVVEKKRLAAIKLNEMRSHANEESILFYLSDSVLNELIIEGINIKLDQSFNLNELRHIAVNFAINCEKGYGGDFDSWFNKTSPDWREIANRK